MTGIIRKFSHKNRFKPFRYSKIKKQIRPAARTPISDRSQIMVKFSLNLKKISIDKIIKLFAEQSEMSALPAGKSKTWTCVHNCSNDVFETLKDTRFI